VHIPGSRAAAAGRRLVLAPAVLCLLSLTGACGDSSVADGGPAATSASGSPSSPQSEGTSPSAGSTRFAVVGDSITAGMAAIEGTTVRDRGSWIPAALQDGSLEFAGGYAVPGATTTAMRTAAPPVDADVLVVMGGTNDLRTGVPWEVTRDNLLALVPAVGVPTVVLSAIPPCDAVPAGVGELNAALAELAAGQGWTFVDPWSDLDADGAWVPGTSDDGLHPTEQVATLIGERLAAAVAAAG
jgi:lysophospholipase L1-like esterase